MFTLFKTVNIQLHISKNLLLVFDFPSIKQVIEALTMDLELDLISINGIYLGPD